MSFALPFTFKQTSVHTDFPFSRFAPYVSYTFYKFYLGAFAINTDHASVLERQPDGWMRWDPVSLKLSWLGFEDIHSGIHTYIINVGSSYMGNDLNKVIKQFVFTS